MKRSFLLTASVLAAAVLMAAAPAGTAFSADETASSVMLGKALFSDTELGTNGMTCSACHPSQEKIAELAARGTWFGGRAKTLEQAVNICIKGPLAGEPLPEDSVKLRAIADYMRSLVKP